MVRLLALKPAESSLATNSTQVIPGAFDGSCRSSSHCRFNALRVEAEGNVGDLKYWLGSEA